MSKMKAQLDFPFKDVVKTAIQQIEDGGEVHQKFTCAGCGARLTIDEPNVFHRTGTCDQCDVITDIEKQGCNYAVVFWGLRSG
jgi:hypothetical protein